MTEGLDIEYNRIVDIIGEEVELRVVHSLFMLANKFGPNLQLKREELANYAGTTTETAIRILSKLRKKGSSAALPAGVPSLFPIYPDSRTYKNGNDARFSLCEYHKFTRPR